MDECIESNTIGTHAVFSFCMSNKIRLIYSATSASLGNRGSDKDLSPYAFTKAKNLEMLENLKKWFGFKYEIIYFYNLYGPLYQYVLGFCPLLYQVHDYLLKIKLVYNLE